MNVSRFTASDDEQLIELVHGHPIIWNLTDKNYKNVVKKEVIWSEIGKMLKRSGAECKARWKNVKDYYKKQKKEERNTTTGSAATKRKAGYWDRLRFLDVVPDERSTVTNIETTHSEESVDGSLYSVDDALSAPAATSNVESTVAIVESETIVNVQDRGDKREANKSTETKLNKKVRKESSIVEALKERQINREEHRKKIELLLEKKEEDDMDLFFKTMAATTKKFSPELKRQAKIRVFNIITELEGQNQGVLSTFNYNHYSGRSSSAGSNTTGSCSEGPTPLPLDKNTYDSWLWSKM